MKVALSRELRLVGQSYPTGWLQAGFSSFAYRLAHLALPRPLSVLGVFVLFYLA